MVTVLKVTSNFATAAMDNDFRLDGSLTRFTHKDWTCSNLRKYANANTERQNAERLVAESLRLQDEAEAQTKKTQNDVNKKFDQRLDDLKFWKSEIDKKLDDITEEIDCLETFKRRLQAALEDCYNPLNIAKQCLLFREHRQGIDLVHDDVQKELLKECEVIEGAIALLTRTIEQSKEQLRRNRKAKYNLQMDLKDKLHGINIDEYCQQLRSHSSDIDYNDAAVKISPKSVSVDEWQAFSNKNIIKAEQERETSTNLRSLIDGILQQIANDMKQQGDAVNLAFSRRISETRATKQKLGDNLNKVHQQILELEENISRLLIAIADKEQPLKLAETRLEKRDFRPNVELCRDQVQYRLIKEVHELRLSIKELQNCLYESNCTMKKLLQNQRDLEADIDVKAKSLFIDEVECMGLRKSINIQAY
ncbi:tektin-1-like [Octopus sinensis]|uniref:Tektin n=1 Tax=Octopus sinensis TaxID=2607531 RepID=A0A6P7SK02_9MOLL|nr:tektin-1-like [Octopus sinensis]